MIGSTSNLLRAGAVAGATTLFLASCHVGPNYRPPALPEGAAAPLVGVNTALEAPTQPPDAWWHLYSDPRLDDLVQEALQANRDLAAADANLAAARAAVAEVHARRYPSTDVSAGAVRGRDPVTDEILELTGRPPQTIWLYEDVFQVAYEVDLFGRIHRAIEAANANAESVAAARDSVRVVAVASTARSYAAVCALGEELNVARHSLDVVSRQAAITKQRYEAGGGSEFDVTRAQALVVAPVVITSSTKMTFSPCRTFPTHGANAAPTLAAPEHEQSGASRALTLSEPLRMRPSSSKSASRRHKWHLSFR